MTYPCSNNPQSSLKAAGLAEDLSLGVMILLAAGPRLVHSVAESSAMCL